MRIALVGDSHTQVVWPALKKLLSATGYVVCLQEANPGWDVKSYQEKMNLPQKLASCNPDVVVYGLGGNNFELTSDAYSRRIAWAIDAARNAGAKRILWVGPATAKRADVNDRHQKTADILASILPSYHVEFLDTRPFTLSGQRSDGVHFDSATYQRWAQRIADALANAPEASPGRFVPSGGPRDGGKPAKAPKGSQTPSRWLWVGGGLGLLALAALAFGSSHRQGR